jgi:hypothetical protein
MCTQADRRKIFDLVIDMLLEDPELEDIKLGCAAGQASTRVPRGRMRAHPTGPSQRALPQPARPAPAGTPCQHALPLPARPAPASTQAEPAAVELWGWLGTPAQGT